MDSVSNEESSDMQRAVDEARRRADEVERDESELVDLGEALADLRADLDRVHQG